MGTWHDPTLGRPIAAPLPQCAELLGVDLATVRKLATNVEPYLRADGTRIWSLMQLERQLRPEAYRRRRGGYLDRRRMPAADGRGMRRRTPQNGVCEVVAVADARQIIATLTSSIVDSDCPLLSLKFR